MESDADTLVPPRRLGNLLRQARVAAGLNLADLTVHTDLTTVDLDDLEHGRRLVDDALLDELIRLYGVEDAGLVPERSQLIIDLDEGRIAVARSDIAVGEMSGPDAILARYLALVYRLRELPIGSPIGLRDIDMDVLSTALKLETTDIEGRLKRLMANEDEIEKDQRRIRRRLLLPLVGVVIAATASGVLVLVAENNTEPEVTTSTAVMIDADTDVGTAAVAAATTVETDLGNGAATVEAPAVATNIGSGGAVIENQDAG